VLRQSGISFASETRRPGENGQARRRRSNRPGHSQANGPVGVQYAEEWSIGPPKEQAVFAVNLSGTTDGGGSGATAPLAEQEI